MSSMNSLYEKAIKKRLKSHDREDIDPEWVEDYMRNIFGTLDHLSKEQFDFWIEDAIRFKMHLEELEQH
jgi:BMFP domain-containing protein YqiC